MADLFRLAIAKLQPIRWMGIKKTAVGVLAVIAFTSLVLFIFVLQRSPLEHRSTLPGPAAEVGLAAQPGRQAGGKVGHRRAADAALPPRFAAVAAAADAAQPPQAAVAAVGAAPAAIVVGFPADGEGSVVGSSGSGSIGGSGESASSAAGAWSTWARTGGPRTSALTSQFTRRAKGCMFGV